ncbi:Protein of unknown function [Thalassobacillus cyri]|uniref:DUF2512 family protein n=1 Tax=Thalassobacillus cyri TaxID=571932 RepID=A0A1H3W727_9BACI|nr:DUF2512 family protein [Thalassobacillus cyri]SDZ82876.1 Protein of unknown function [Thalassobacillus cyri]
MSKMNFSMLFNLKKPQRQLINSLFIKLILIPIVLFIGMFSTEHIEYGALWQPVVLSIVLIVVGISMEKMVLSKETLGASVFMDFIVSLLIILALSNWFPNAMVTFIGAFTLAVVLGTSEYFLHRFLLALRNKSNSVSIEP